MKSLHAFLFAFGATLLMLGAVLLSNEFGLVWLVVVGLMLVGSFVVLGWQVGWDLFGANRPKWAGAVAVASILTILTLTLAFDIFPYAWNGLAMLLLAVCLAWRLVCDYASLFVRSQSPTAPADWSALHRGELPHAEHEEVSRQKDRLARSCEVHGKFVTRIGQFGTVSQPLKMNE